MVQATAVRAIADARAKAVAMRFIHQLRLAVDHCDSTFCTGTYALSATVAELLVDLDDGPSLGHEDLLPNRSIARISPGGLDIGQAAP